MNLDEYLMKELNISKKEAYQISYAVNKYTKEKKKIKLNIKLPNYTVGEEIFNSISHGIGAILSIVALILMVVKAHGILPETTVTLFGCAMIILYTISCIYHALSPALEGKKVLRVIDHCNVFLLVYGTYIPIALIGVGGIKGLILFIIISIVTLIGIFLTSIKIDKTQVLQVICHLINGWGVLVVIPSLIDSLGVIGVLFLVIGGIMYSIGSLLYAIGRKRKYMHSIFHVFCLLGTLFHFLCVYLFLL